MEQQTTDPVTSTPQVTQSIGSEETHWSKMFLLCALVIGAVILYCFLITFLPIPKDNQETARQVLIFFIGTLVGYCFNLLSPGISSSIKKDAPVVQQTGDNPSNTIQS